MMATLPSVPSFASNDNSLTSLQNLSYAVSFLVDLDVRPVWHLYTGSTHAVAANTVITESFPLVAYDNDLVSDGTGVTIKTSGYYTVETCLDFAGNAASEHIMAWFQLTAGANNPNLTNGTTKIFGANGLLSASSAGDDIAMCAADVCPYALYQGDQIKVQYNSDTATTRYTNTNASYISQRFVPNFTGMMIRPV
jgi:hypothetical protein